jgi:hypothetical protein
MPSPAPVSVLILRTVSVEKLDGVLAACRERWPAARLVVLTNPGRQAELEADERIAEVVPHALGPVGFDRSVRLARRFDIVVVPVGNRGGSGYANVICAALNCPAREYFLAAHARDLRAVPRWRLRLSVAGESLLLALSLPPAWLRSRFHHW